MQREYGHQSYGRGMDSYAVDNPTERFGPYESYDSRSSVGGRDLYRSGYGYNESEQGYGDSYDDQYETQYRSSVDSYDGRNQGGSSWDPSFTRAKVRTGFMEDRGRDTYSSYGAYSSPYMKPATVGSRGRGMPAYTDGAFGGRSNDAFGGPAAGRGRGRRQFGRGMRRPAMFDSKQQSMSGGMARGIKRKMGQPFKQPLGTAKKTKLTAAGGNQNAVNTTASESVDPEEEQRRTEARKRQRRRREKNSEKYGDGIVFTCSFCKFRSFDEKGIEEHLESPAHQKILDHIQKQTKFDKPVMEFLHECIVNKYKRTSARKVQTKILDPLDGVTPDDHMIKVESVHCSICNVYVPPVHSSVLGHLTVADHLKKKTGYNDQIKIDSTLTATSILNNPVVKARYELYLKGENPFEVQITTAEDVPEGAAAEGGAAEGAAAESVAAEVGAAEVDAADFASDDFTADTLASTE